MPPTAARRLAPATPPILGGWLLLVTLALGAPDLRAQPTSGPTGVVAGTVTDGVAHTPLTGVAVALDGTRFGAATGADGRYRITGVPAGTYTAIARRIGYNPTRLSVTVTAGREATADFGLQASAIALDQVVISGTAGETQRREVGNAVATIDAATALQQSAAPNVASLLNARAPGVAVRQRTGRLGAGPTIEVRGRSSLSLENSPLIYVDGVRVNNQTSSGPQAVAGRLGGQGSQVGGRLNDINPDDIESIEVIKGPAAATIYGTEAANGVIQIITKKGAAGAAPQISAQVEEGSLEFANAVDRVQTNYFKDPTSGQIVTWNGLQQEADSGRPIYKTGQTRKFTGSLSGGRDALRYYLGSTYENDLGIEPNNSLRQFSLHTNLNSSVRPSTELAMSVNYVAGDTHLGADYGASPLLGAQVGHRLLFAGTRGFFAVPPEVPQQLYDNSTRVDRFTGSATITNRPASWFTQRAIVGLDYAGSDERALERFAPPEIARYLTAAAAGGAIGQTLRHNSVFTGDYNGSARVSLTSALSSKSSVGGQFYKTALNSSFLGGTAFPAPGVDIVSGTTAPVASSQSETINTTIGAYAEQQFGWHDRLFLSGALRVDNNSAFGEDFKWVTYPKVSASWVVNEEPFWERWRNAVNTLRLRAAYGESGRQPAAFSALRTFAATTGPGGSSAVTPNSLGNPDLKPERGKEVELGFEAGLYNRLTLDFTYYNKKTYDEIVQQPVAPSSGFPGTQYRNLGQVDNKGVELSANLRAVARRTVSWDINANVATNKDVIRDLGGLPTIIASYGAANVVGYPIGGIFVRHVISAERNATTGQATNILCEGPNGTGVACATAPFVFWGTPTPKVTGAVSSTVTLWQRLSLYGLADFRRGNKLQNSVELLRCTGAVGGALCRANYYPQEYDPLYLAETNINAVALGTVDQYIQDAGFTKLREISATYTFPERITRARTSLTIAGRNLYTWTKYRGIDPESNINNAATTTATLDQAVTPPLRSFVATVRVTW
ncbi:TonB-dependent outer membrane protein, SusC/RagA (plasmid) [Gemmatirosa kalamazoonensis]|uniref:TonB-dependent outer membrane protein, SusC/RagA n=1 Tax=Gemmatirosa kalamazoonensis TaxID=861299 RepID=W0RVK7_9BACT|nr:SusC/RagA family TonB-linked outer membrane protein [Gemmatirosa kalamazoonensis]AHG93618.1 TonB-dependent outer membrane protein, SusC/RagA [Gemmatirosa kalamazoonensis]